MQSNDVNKPKKSIESVESVEPKKSVESMEWADSMESIDLKDSVEVKEPSAPMDPAATSEEEEEAYVPKSASRLIAQFEKMSIKQVGLQSQTALLIEKFEKISQGIDAKSIKVDINAVVAKPPAPKQSDDKGASKVIGRGNAVLLIERFKAKEN